MGIITGLQSIKKHDEELEQRRASRGQKVNWLTVPKNGKVELIFLQEIDPGSERYSEKNGLAILVQEHNNPSRTEFYKRVMCTNNEEHEFQCWGCEKNQMEWSKSTDENKYNGGWKAKQNFYINVLARYINEENEKVEEVAVLQRVRNPKSYVNQIIEFAEDDGFVSNRVFTLSRKGEGFDTVYTLTHRKEDAGINVEDYEVFDLTKLVREVDYEEQAAALGVSIAPPRVDLSSDSSDPEDEDSDWI